MDILQTFLLSFIPLFAAIDVLGVLPIFITFTSELSAGGKKSLITQATVTALSISALFLLAGKIIFNALGITENDFRIAGGILLLITAMMNLLVSRDEEKRKPVGDTVGVVPIGIPLIMGPAALTTILITSESYGFVSTLASIVINLLIVWIAFRNSNTIVRLIGISGTAAFAKVFSLLLAAIAVMMIRVGIQNIFMN